MAATRAPRPTFPTGHLSLPCPWLADKWLGPAQHPEVRLQDHFTPPGLTSSDIVDIGNVWSLITGTGLKAKQTKSFQGLGFLKSRYRTQPEPQLFSLQFHSARSSPSSEPPLGHGTECCGVQGGPPTCLSVQAPLSTPVLQE